MRQNIRDELLGVRDRRIKTPLRNKNGKRIEVSQKIDELVREEKNLSAQIQKFRTKMKELVISLEDIKNLPQTIPRLAVDEDAILQLLHLVPREKVFLIFNLLIGDSENNFFTDFSEDEVTAKDIIEDMISSLGQEPARTQLVRLFRDSETQEEKRR